MRNTFISIILILLSMTTCQSDRLINIHDNFESDGLNKIWSNDKFVSGGLTFQSKYTRSGNKAAMLTLKQGDQIDKEKGSINERAELKESDELFSSENSNYSYSFSIFLPPDFPVVPTRLVIAQWKQDCESGDCDPDNPVIALRYQSGTFFVTLQVGPERTTLYSQSDSILNKWLDFKFNIRFSRKPDGIIEAWQNGKQIIDYAGTTAYSKTFGYPIPGVFYFKIGLYRNSMDKPMTIYIDDYSKQHIPKL
jgi:hypothetical protein